METSTESNLLSAQFRGQQVNVLLDPGSIPASFANTAWAVKNRIQMFKLDAPQRVRLPTNTVVHSFYYVFLKDLILSKVSNEDVIKIDDVKVFLMEDLKPDIILGSAAIYKYRLYEELAVLEERRQRNEPTFNDVDIPSLAAMDQEKAVRLPEVDKLVEAYRKKGLFSEELPQRAAKLDPIKIELLDKLPDAWPPKALQGAPRRQPQQYWEEIVRQVNELESAGVVERSEGELWSQVLLVKKPNGSMRLCIDYKELNKYTKSLSYPLPDIEMIVQQLAGSTPFCYIGYDVWVSST